METNITQNNGYKPLTPFKFWCSKVLPLVYDDSLSYYELLCKLVNTVNKTIENVDTLNDNLNSAYTELKTLIKNVDKRLDDYFSDERFRNTVDSKIDEMFSDGYFDGKLEELFSNYNFSILKAINPKYKRYGNALSDLYSKLTNPLCQFINVYFIGDSITWGRAASGNSTSSPRNHELTDARNGQSDLSFVNQFIKHIGDTYIRGNKVESNWVGSPSGNCIAEYNTEYIIGTRTDEYLTITTSGTGGRNTHSESANSPSGTREAVTAYPATDASSSPTFVFNMTFPFSGNAFSVLYAEVKDQPCSGFKVYVNNNLVAQLEPFTGTENSWRREFGVLLPSYVKDATVKIEVSSENLRGMEYLNYSMPLLGIKIPKKVRITNQGLIGTTAYTWKTMVVSAIPDATHVFVQLGTNDLTYLNGTSNGTQIDFFERNLLDTIQAIRGITDKVIMMCANPQSLNVSAGGYKMLDIHNSIARICRTSEYDFIDNYSLFDGYEETYFLDAHIHPNDTGHTIIYSNIISALET